jgi:uncharacterized Zn-binding protein involved in type VI secretion
VSVVWWEKMTRGFDCCVNGLHCNLRGSKITPHKHIQVFNLGKWSGHGFSGVSFQFFSASTVIIRCQSTKIDENLWFYKGRSIAGNRHNPGSVQHFQCYRSIIADTTRWRFVMGQPAARVSDMHTCPMVTGVVPHVGGPILPPGCPTVMIGNLPAARATDQATCVGPPDVIAKGSGTVLIGKMPAARMGDNTGHGGVIVLGCFTVLIGG